MTSLIQFLIAITLFMFAMDAYSAPVPMKHNNYKESSRGSLLTREDFQLLETFDVAEVPPASMSFEKFSNALFVQGARAKAVNSFSFASGDPEVSSEFRAMFNGDQFNYDYDVRRKTLRMHDTREREEQEYEIRKAFAVHAIKKIGDYHFNKYIKYNPRIEKVVRSVENIDVSVQIAKPSRPGGKPTKVKLKANPFKTELKLSYTSEFADGEAKYHLLNGSLTTFVQKPTKYVNLRVDYNVGNVKVGSVALARTYSVGMNKRVYKDLTASLSLSGNEKFGSRGEAPNKVFLNFTMPL
jgi:hypothetical protein